MGGITVTNIPGLAGGSITTADADSLRLDTSRDALWLRDEDVGMRRFSMNLLMGETHQYSFDDAIDPNAGGAVYALGASGYMYGNQTSADQRINKVDPTTGITVATFGTAGTGTSMSSTNFGSSCQMCENTTALGASLLLVVNLHDDVGLLSTDAMTYIAHSNGAFETQTGGEIVPLPPEPITGKARWFVHSIDLGGTTREVYLVKGTTSTLEIALFHSFTAANDATLWGGDVGQGNIASYWLDPDSETVIGLIDDTSSGGNSRIAAWAVAAPTVPLWTAALTGNHSQTTYAGGKIVDQRLGLTTSGAGGNSANKHAYLINTLDGTTVDSGLVDLAHDVNATGQYWDGARGYLYNQSNSGTNPLFVVSFDSIGQDPDDPEEPLDPLDPDEALILRGSDLTSIINRFGNQMENDLTNYLDKAGGNVVTDRAIDLNGFRITNIVPATAPSDLITLAQAQELIDG